jgi:hypothetical protein
VLALRPQRLTVASLLKEWNGRLTCSPVLEFFINSDAVVRMGNLDMNKKQTVELKLPRAGTEFLHCRPD